jgi:hypothetical protein
MSKLFLAAGIASNCIATTILLKLPKIEIDVVGKALIALNIAAGMYGSISFFM